MGPLLGPLRLHRARRRSHPFKSFIKRLLVIVAFQLAGEVFEFLRLGPFIANLVGHSFTKSNSACSAVGLTIFNLYLPQIIPPGETEVEANKRNVSAFLIRIPRVKLRNLMYYCRRQLKSNPLRTSSYTAG